MTKQTSISRIYQNQPLSVGKPLLLTHDAHHYVAHVLRMKKGDPLIIFNGEGGEYQGLINDIDKKNYRSDTQYFFDKQCRIPSRALSRARDFSWH